MDGCHLSQNSETPLLRKTPQDKRAVTRRPQDPFAVLKRSLGNQGTRNLLNTGALQAKLTVNQPGDVFEQEADHVADQVMHTPDAAEPRVQRTATSQARDATASPVVHDLLSSPGQSLDPATRAFMEPRFGYDFGGVRVHADAKAAESARAVNALAYTVRRDVVFGAGQYAPGTSAGQRLIAHELTHVVQQTGGETLSLQRTGVEEEKAEVPAESAPTSTETTPAAPEVAGEVTDAAIDALDLAPTAKAAAKELKKKHPDITFTSGRRTIAEQASAMAANVVSSKNRNWIENTYASAAALQKWVDDHPAATTQKDIAAGLENTMNGMSEADRGRISKHLSGEAFDVQPQEKDAEAIKNDIQALPSLSKFLDKEGGLVRWHAQFKRADGAPNGYDPLEQEADRVAEQVARMPDAAEPLVQRTATSQVRDATVPPVVHDVLSSPGQPLDPAMRAFMEPRFGYDFGGVRVHIDAQAAESARAVNALAYTVGRDVVFGVGQYAPGTSIGQQLIAHELTHVLQQAVMARTSALHIDARNARRIRDPTSEAPLAQTGEWPADTYSAPGHTLMRQTGNEQQSVDVQQPESAGFWGTIGGGLMGEFNEDPGFAMMGVDVGVSLIPILDQVSDIRDIVAHLYFMIFHNQYDRFMRWLGLVFTLIGLVPEVGSAIKGASKFVIKGVHEVLSHLEDLLLPVTRLLPDIMDFGRLYRYVAANWNRWMTIGLGAWEQAIGRVMQIANAIPAFLNRHLRIIHEGLDRIRQLAPAKLREAFDWARRKWDEIMQFIKRPGDEELEQAFLRLERGETPQEGALLSDLLHHSQQDEALAELRRRSGTAMPGRPGRTPKGASINPQPGFQSAHTTPQSALRNLAQYDPGDMITRILPTGRGHPHTVFDQFWQEEFRQIRKRTGRTTITASELHQVLERAARQSGAFSPAEAESVVGLIHEDLFVRLGLTENKVLRIPGT